MGADQGIEWAEYAPELVSQLGNSPPHGAEEEMSRSEAVSE